jgi:hypothetical protein
MESIKSDKTGLRLFNMNKLSLLRRLINIWPPFLGAGIRVNKIAPDATRIEVEMKLRWWNRNYMGTQFGGSLYSMTDPFFAIILLENLGKDYIVWDKAGTIRYKSPGRGRVIAKFEISLDEIQSIRDRVDKEGKINSHFHVPVLDNQGKVIAEVEKTLSIRRKDKLKY